MIALLVNEGPNLPAAVLDTAIAAALEERRSLLLPPLLLELPRV